VVDESRNARPYEPESLQDVEPGNAVPRLLPLCALIFLRRKIDKRGRRPYTPTRTNDHISDAPGEEPIVCQSKIAGVGMCLLEEKNRPMVLNKEGCMSSIADTSVKIQTTCVVREGKTEVNAINHFDPLPIINTNKDIHSDITSFKIHTTHISLEFFAYSSRPNCSNSTMFSSMKAVMKC
jgi:hypothetical protein